MRREVINYFAVPRAAVRYAQSRPNLHAAALEWLAAKLAGRVPVAAALDVGCGTGGSTLALLTCARHVTGVDSSPAMLAQAPLHARIDYRKGAAEALPFEADAFDLVTASSALHWFEPERFLGEVARVLRPGGWLMIYRGGTSGSLEPRTAFETWREDVFHRRFPKVDRHDSALDPALSAQFGLVTAARETLVQAREHELAGYVENLMTHSNVIRAIDCAGEPESEVRAWLRRELTPFFPEGRALVRHESRVHLLQLSR